MVREPCSLEIPQSAWAASITGQGRLCLPKRPGMAPPTLGLGVPAAAVGVLWQGERLKGEREGQGLRQKERGVGLVSPNGQFTCPPRQSGGRKTWSAPKR